MNITFTKFYLCISNFDFPENKDWEDIFRIRGNSQFVTTDGFFLVGPVLVTFHLHNKEEMVQSMKWISISFCGPCGKFIKFSFILHLFIYMYIFSSMETIISTCKMISNTSE